MKKQKRVLNAHLDIKFYVSSPHSYGYATRPLWEQYRARQYSTAIFVYSHKEHYIILVDKVKLEFQMLF